jgi:hypothetical protein
MPVSPGQQRLNLGERANLAASIDRQLSDDESRALAPKLTHSATARRELELLRETWELFEYLPLPSHVSSQFSECTLSQTRFPDSKGHSWEVVFRGGDPRHKVGLLAC